MCMSVVRERLHMCVWYMSACVYDCIYVCTSINFILTDVVVNNPLMAKFSGTTGQIAESHHTKCSIHRTT